MGRRVSAVRPPDRSRSESIPESHCAAAAAQGMTASGARQNATFRLGPVEYPAVRLGAARSVADLAVHQHGLDEIGSKLAEIEAVQRQSHLSGGE